MLSNVLGLDTPWTTISRVAYRRLGEQVHILQILAQCNQIKAEAFVVEVFDTQFSVSDNCLHVFCDHPKTERSGGGATYSTSQESSEAPPELLITDVCRPKLGTHI
jgi:hypothetical protein